ncbi:acid protease [Flagelloscypha sp. PMI_526]|nr:acid protease [Flagelloscypha sp. PMI_526]
MHFTTLSIFLAFCLYVTTALPVRRARTISFPLKQVRHPDRDLLSPRDLHAHHCLNAEKRMARFIGVPTPSDEELIAKRSTLHKRFNHIGVDKKEHDRRAATTITIETTITSTVETLFTTSTTTIRVLPTAAPSSPAVSLPATFTLQSSQSLATSAPSAEATNIASQDGTAPLRNFGGDVGYFAILQMGTPPRDFKVVMDSGSSDFWLMSESNCREFVDTDNGPVNTGKGCGNHTFTGTKSSSTLKTTNEPFEVTYGSGHVIGKQAKDDLILAGHDVKGITFGLGDRLADKFTEDVFDGLMGTATSRLSDLKVPTPVESLKDQGFVTQAITSYKMSREKDGVDDGSITFGGLDSELFAQETLVTIPNVSDVGFWEGAMEEMTVDGKPLDIDTTSTILDTGSTLMLVPPADAKKIHAAIPGAQSTADGFVLPCDTKTVVSFQFGGKAFKVDPRDLTFNTLPGGKMCTSSVIGNDIADGKWLLGDAFLKNVYFSHNVDTNEISLAELK